MEMSSRREEISETGRTRGNSHRGPPNVRGKSMNYRQSKSARQFSIL